jgi:hypothetical protein
VVDLVLDGSEPLCTGQTYDFRGAFEVLDLTGETDGLFGIVQVRQMTKLGKSALYGGCIMNAVDCNTPSDGDFPGVWFYRLNYFRIQYTAPDKPGTEELIIEFYDVVGNLLGRALFEYKVVNCNISLHGTTDVGATANAMSPGNVWDFVGTYDITGTLEPQEDGTLRGQATASLFMDAIISVEGPMSCGTLTPWQGATAVEIEADPNAWARDGVLDLRFQLEPMPVNSSGITCKSSMGGATVAFPSITVASFDLDFPPLPGGGGSTSLDFQFPGEPGTFKMDLIASSQEADS